MEELMKYGSYREYKERLDEEWKNTALQAVKLVEGFVRVGYLLKQARDTDVLEASGYRNVNEFAKAEYGIDKTVVSRYISINDRFSEGGNSEYLEERYRGFGFAKLTIMLQLPDALNEELSPEYSKAEIQAVKEEVDEEKKITDLEVMLEGQDPEEYAMGDLEKVIRRLGHDMPQLYADLYRAREAYGSSAQVLQEVLAPAGEKLYSIRIQGVGRMMLSVKDTGQPVTLTNIRSSEKQAFRWEEVQQAVDQIMEPAAGPEASWEAVYGEAFPEKEKVAPVQQQRKPEPVRQTKVEKAKPKEKRPAEEEKKETEDNLQQIPEKETGQQAPAGEPEQRDTAEGKGQQAEETDQLPGQMEITDYPKMLPESMRQESGAETDQTVEAENAGNTDCGETLEGEVPTEEELHGEALETARKIVKLLEEWEQLPENLLEECLKESENLMTAVKELYHTGRSRRQQNRERNITEERT